MNRWFHDITAFISSAGGIDPASIAGFTALQTQVNTNTTNIATNTTNITTNTSGIASNSASITTLNTQMSTANTNISALQAATANIVRSGSGVPGAGLGNNGDVYTNLTGGAGTRLYGKYVGAWVALA